MRFVIITLVLLTGMFIWPAFARVAPHEQVAMSPAYLDAAEATQAILTFAKNGSSDVRAFYFPNVANLNSCRALAYSAVSQHGGESSAVCMNDHRDVVGTYYCEGGPGAARCKIMLH